MKKTLKTLIAVFLAMIIATGSVSAFAAKETVILDYIDEKYEYFYGSQLTEGKNSIDLSGDELYYYHDFKAEKDGYYIIETNPMHIWWIAVAEETSSGRYIDEALTDYTNISYEEENEKNILSELISNLSQDAGIDEISTLLDGIKQKSYKQKELK